MLYEGSACRCDSRKDGNAPEGLASEETVEAAAVVDVSLAGQEYPVGLNGEV